MTTFLNEVEKHAKRNYEKGWDVWVETMDDEEKLAVLKGAKTEKGAIKKAWNDIKAYVAYRKEHLGRTGPFGSN